MKQYYDRRAPEYDEWYYGAGQYRGREREGWHEEVEGLTAALAELPPARILDVACGTGFLTQHLTGEIVLLDQSEAMLAVAKKRLPAARAVQADVAAGLPFADDSFDRVFTGHFYGHLEPAARDAFVREARRVARELVIVDSALREDVEAEEWQERILNDGSRWQVYKRYFTPEALLAELGGGRTLFSGRWFVAVAA